MITISNLPYALSFLIKDDNTFVRLQTDFPDILADLISFKNNPSCSCRGRVIKFFGEKLQQNATILNEYIYDPVGLQNEIVLAEQARQLNSYSGKIITIPKNEEAWKNLSTDINNGKIFRAFSVLEKDNELVVYFL